MAFYEEIAKYYEYIFPVGQEQIKLITECAGESPKMILDIACGNGGYALALAKQGYQVTAMDLDETMIDKVKAAALATNLPVHAVQADMLKLEMLTAATLTDSMFDLAFCIGNSLVHLNGEDEIISFFQGVKKRLNDEGHLIVQIVNYDRILAQDIRSLPTIINDKIGLRFERRYQYDPTTHKILFKTLLEVENNHYENEIALYPILAKDVVRLLHLAGFEQVQIYGDFKRNAYDALQSAAAVFIAS